MKLRTLQIHNIASIGDATIRFDSAPLAGADVFLICGETGAGKTIILDAICLALFDAVPRMGTGRSELKFNDMSIKDARQLLRLGTREGYIALTFAGNDGNEYEATWEVRRTRTKVVSKHTLIVNGDASRALTRKREVAEAVEKALNVDYAQYVRTSMLAQGEFTRFLDSDDNEKARILEKLTGAERFARIGAEIYRLASEKEKALQTLLERAEGTELLSEEALAQLSEREGVLKGEIDTLRKQEAALTSAVRWYELKEQYEKRALVLDAQVTAAKAQLEAPEYKTIKEKLERRAAAASALIALRDSVAAANEMKTVEAQQAKIYPHWQAFLAAVDLLDTELSTQKLQLAEAQKELGELSKVDTDAEAIELARRRAVEERRSLDLLREVARLKPLSDEAAEQLQKAEAEEKDASALFDVLDFSHAQWASIARVSLTPGCTCPVCRQTVEKMPPAEAQINEQWAKALRRRDTAKKSLTAATQTLSQYSAELAAANSAIAKLEYRLDRCPDTDEACAELVAELDAKVKDYDAQLRNIQRINKLSVQIAKLVTQVDSLESRKTSAESARDSMRAQLPALVELAAGKPSREPVEQLQVKLLKTVSAVCTRQESAKASAQDAEQQITDFLAANEDFTREDLVDLGTVSDAQADAWQKQIEAARTLLIEKQGAREENARRLAEHLEKAGDVKELGDDVDNLKTSMQQLKVLIDERQQECGRLEQTRTADAELRRRKADLFLQIEQGEKDIQKYRRLNYFFGDREGSLFRRIALSFVLEQLLVKANSYLERLTDRYRLRGVEGTYLILLEDAYNGYNIRPVVTSSGGESFMVSLALALALADMGQGFMADTLFIDEGFGTLSGEPLSRAVGMLRSLHRSSGRRVGIISHIAQLRSELPLQLRVERSAGAEASTVSIVHP